MNRFRIVLNILLAALLLSAGAHLLGQDAFVLSDRWSPESGTRFQGGALVFLACGLILLGAFAGTVACGWIRGTLPLPDPNVVRPHPAYKGTVILRFWYLVLPAALSLLLAFLLADKTPAPSPQPPQGPGGPEYGVNLQRKKEITCHIMPSTLYWKARGSSSC